jgi:VWFA-related protein
VGRLFFILACGVARYAFGQTVNAPPQSERPTFETKLNVVLVPVLVRDARGQSVGSLKKEDFKVFDNNKLQTVSGFSIERRGAASTGSEVKESASVNEASPANVTPNRFVVFLFDDLHLEASDLIQAKEAGTKMLGDSLADTDVAAVFSISGRTNSGLTQDVTKLTEAIKSLRQESIYRPAGRQCPDIGYYQADLILNKHDDRALDSAVQETVTCTHLPKPAAEQRVRAIASAALSLGNQGTHVTLEMIKFIIKKMGSLPGQHTLILISPGFQTTEAQDEKSEIMDMAARANVTISALNARGLYVNQLQASQSTSGLVSPELLRMKTGYRHDSISADEDVMAELAFGTGGTYFHNNNDLTDGFRKLALAPDYLYLLEFIPEEKRQDGSYHLLKVNVVVDGMKVQARRGYYALKASKKK